MNAIDRLLGDMIEQKASDLHLSVGREPMVRVSGVLLPMAGEARLTREDVERLLDGVLDAATWERLRQERQVDLAYGMSNVARFRVNAYFQRGSLTAAMRLIPFTITSLAGLGMPAQLSRLGELPRGLVIVTGPTGSGKSTTLAAIVDQINTQRDDHIITIEDPIEFLHSHRRCLVNQREIGADAMSFADALRGAMRQDPDVILVGEMRDLETMSTALTAAETGHLVLATLHTQSAASTVDRLIDAFPAGQQSQVRMQLATSLQAVVTQTLLRRSDGAGRAAACEILIVTDAIRNLIRTGKVEQIYSVMQTGASHGMQTLEQALTDLVRTGVITRETAMARTSRPAELADLLERNMTGRSSASALRTVGARNA